MTPMVLADIVGAMVFLVFTMIYLFKHSKPPTDHVDRVDNVHKTYVFAFLFAVISISVAIVLK